MSYVAANGFAMPCAPSPPPELWCPTCGKPTLDGLDCGPCAQWWQDNPPPAHDPTPNAAAFAAANKESPVVAGAATHNGAARPKSVTGVRYTLADGRTFTLTSAECRSIVPRWEL